MALPASKKRRNPGRLPKQGRFRGLRRQGYHLAVAVSPDISEIERLISPERLTSYMSAAGSDLEAAIALYDWNQSVSAALFADIARIEVTFRNVVNLAMSDHHRRRGRRGPWYLESSYFAGRQGRRARENIADARQRVGRKGHQETPGYVIAELMFGFWRFLCAKDYLTNLWVPVLAAAFPNHPAGDVRTIRTDVEDHMQKLHFLRNRIAHHEPIHRRNLADDANAVDELAAWMSADARDWIASRSIVGATISQRP